MSNRQYLSGTPIPMLNALTSGTYQMICEACRVHQLTTNNGVTLYLPHMAGSYDCIEAMGARLEALAFTSVAGVTGSLQPTLDSLENKLRGEYLAADERIMKDVKELRIDLREFVSMPPEQPPPKVSLVISKKDISPDAMKMLEEWKKSGKLSVSFNKPVTLTAEESLTVNLPDMELP